MPDDADAKQVAYSILAQGDLDRLQSYLDRGRRYASLDADDLASTWIAGARAWAATPFEPSNDMDDGTAEYGLRGERPPYDLARDDIERAIAAIGARADQMTADERREANARMVAEHERTTRSSH